MSIDELISEGFHRQEKWSKRVATLLTIAIILLLLIASLLLLQLSQSQHTVVGCRIKSYYTKCIKIKDWRDLVS